MKTEKQENIKSQILLLVEKYYRESYDEACEFDPGKTYINYGGRFFDEKEMKNLIDASLDFWLTAGPWANKFERKFSEWLGIKYCSLVNSGSSANLLAFAALTSPELKERQIKKGDEVITVAAAFPTTVSPIIQYGAIPVFVDVDLKTYNIDVSELENAVSDKTKAVMIAHTLGNPFDLEAVKAFCDKYNLWLIEDNCDALGSCYKIKDEWKRTGTIGDIGTSSFYPPHHITMGEGGAVYTNNHLLYRLVNSFRDWGRDCWCIGGVDNTCKYRYSKQFGELPLGYDHKYVYSHFGYNLKATEMQAAIGCAQLEKIDLITDIRRKNWSALHLLLNNVDGLILPQPQINSNPSWFGFLISVEKKAGFTRNELTTFLENRKIQTRNLFAGNLLKHPAFDEMRKNQTGYRVVGSLYNTDFIMNNTFWLGVYPGMKPEMIEYMADSIKEFTMLKKEKNK